MDQANITRVYTKARKQAGRVIPASQTQFSVKIAPDRQSITLYKHTGGDGGSIVEGRTFVVGDAAEHDSYNLRYLGRIESISDKNITIWPNGHRAPPALRIQGKKNVVRLSLEQFCWRNFNFDLIQALEENLETMNYI